MKRVARYESTVLIQGESGCGKELVARRIHELSERRGGPFVPINCAAIPRELLESELFGHEKGSFTGALATRIGRFELAARGTLFLDEIGDMTLDMQVKLLRVLQERTFERVGSVESRRADVRILAATHRDLEARVAERQFREDLFFRLNVVPIRVPPLRERIEDLPALIADLVKRGVADGRPPIELSEVALACMRTYPWPGNVRELQNLIERLSIMCGGRRVEREDLPQAIGERRHRAQQSRRDVHPERRARSARALGIDRETSDPHGARADRRHRRARGAPLEAAPHDARREASQVRSAGAS